MENEDISQSYSIELDGHVSRKALDDIRNKRKVSKKNIHSQLDFQLLQLSWIFDVNYPPTFKCLFESGIVEKIIQILPDDEGIPCLCSC